MTGTLVNAGGIVLGSLIGLLLRRGIPQHITDAIVRVEGVAIALIGLGGLLSSMLTVDPATGKISSPGGLVLLVCLVLGCLIGELVRIDDRLEALGRLAERKMNTRDFAKGFVTASLLYCVGVMGVIGPIQEGIYGDSTVLYVKSAMDFITSVILSASLGHGVAFAAVPVFVLQGLMTLLSGRIAFLFTESDVLLGLVCMVGYAIVIVIGVNFVSKINIKTANLLPALLLVVLYYFIFPQ